MNSFYLKPVGLMYGQIAGEAIRAGKAGRIAGGPIAFNQVEVLEKREASLERTFCQFGDISQTADNSILARLNAIQSSRQDICGLRMDRPVIMGIVNVTPDSFSDGGLYFDQSNAIQHGLQMHKEFADIVDVGGESTRPGAEDISLNEELGRVIPVIKALNSEDCLLSIDTRRAEVMEKAISSGADIVNDVSALSFDPKSSEVIRRYGKPVILMHSRGIPKTMQENPTYQNVVAEVFDELESSIQRSLDSGISRSQIIADPGIGFGKSAEHNLNLLNNLSLLHGLGVPLLLGVSRKSFIGHITGESDPSLRLPGSLAGLLIGLQQGIQMFRVHDVAASRQAADVWMSVTTGFKQKNKKRCKVSRNE